MHITREILAESEKLRLQDILCFQQELEIL